METKANVGEFYRADLFDATVKLHAALRSLGRMGKVEMVEQLEVVFDHLNAELEETRRIEREAKQS